MSFCGFNTSRRGSFLQLKIRSHRWARSLGNVFWPPIYLWTKYFARISHFISNRIPQRACIHWHFCESMGREAIIYGLCFIGKKMDAQDGWVVSALFYFKPDYSAWVAPIIDAQVWIQEELGTCMLSLCFYISLFQLWIHYLVPSSSRSAKMHAKLRLAIVVKLTSHHTWFLSAS